ncbi:Asp-tRNA(Asn)/Glu-tRNA(Gln) amidotransferase subunit GatB [Candidatus Sumerlaeota bacterium]|nr:Asp-tRNA(Asn)/Glu-tRNA(Gln) amidotransferase subunit GatB [Candidatus Sumerlaeota bacterium]
MKYETIIGFEVHVELSTNTKVFCGCSTVFGQPPNTQVCPVCLGLPGSLPVLNRKALDLSLRTAVALNCRINRQCQFERKNYYYPDLPKNYQISQLRQNLGVDGFLDIPIGDGSEQKRIRIHNIHLEEDAGKNVHPENAAADCSLVDLNRTGTPLLEIVSEPDIRGADEAMAYMQALKNLLEYIQVSDCNMHEGRLRFEVNISHRLAGETELPSFRSEIKNLGSMKSAVRCIEYEAKRQTRALDRGETLGRDTRLWDDETGRSQAMRSKESAHDYRYFPEPDLVELDIENDWIERVRAELPELPAAKKARFIERYGLPEYDAGVLTASRPLAEYYEQVVAAHDNPKAASNWIMTELLRELNEREIEARESPVAPEHLGKMIRMIDAKTISGKIAKDVFAEMLAGGGDPERIVQDKGWVQVTDSGQVETWVDEAIRANPGPASDYGQGKDRAMGFLVGQVMRLSQGKANPGLVNELIKKRLRP